MVDEKDTRLQSDRDLNFDRDVVSGFGMEWCTFNQSEVSDEQLLAAFNQYFHIFPLEELGPNSVGFDMGCGSGRWAKLVAPKVGKLTCIDASSLALDQAKKNLASLSNVEYECASVSSSNLENGSQDFGYCLGVLHHIPDTFRGIRDCASKLKPGAPFLIYLYYRFDNKPFWYRWLWCLADILRRGICVLPYLLKLPITQIIAMLIYLPFSRLAALFEKFGLNVENFPLAVYRNKSFYFMKTDALDRFGTRIEKRFTQDDIRQMLLNAGFCDIRFSCDAPFWVAVAIKK